MREQVLRAATLCFFGNEYLRCPDDSVLAEVYLKACFKGVERLEFVRPNAHQFAAPGIGFVHGSKTWFRRLKSDGVEEMRLHLPISLLEALPEQYGIVTDSDHGSDIWVPSPGNSRRNVEYNAQRFAVWSLPRLDTASVSFSAMIQAIARINVVLRGQPTHLSNCMSRLAGVLSQSSHVSTGYDDSIPASFDSLRTALAKSAIHTVVALTNSDLGLDDQPSLREDVDQIWSLALRVLEGINAEIVMQNISSSAA